jgi:hypothetical protein
MDTEFKIAIYEVHSEIFLLCRTFKQQYMSKLYYT